MIQFVLPVATLGVIVLGGIAASISFRGYRQNSSISMLCLSIGFLLMVAAPVTATLLFGFSPLGLWEIQLIESALIAFGFAYVVHSMYTKRL